MEQTPPMRLVRQRHTPTPKMSERKKNLFTSSALKANCPSPIDEDSDLGPMSPLQFSCSPSSYDTTYHGRLIKNRESRTDFKNIMLQLSPMQSNNRPIDRTPTKNSNEPKPSTSSDYERVSDSPQSTKSSDLFNLEKENCIESAQKTPSTTDVPTNTEFPRMSFRKSLIFDTGMTPDERYLSPKTKKSMKKRSALSEYVDDEDSANENPKARASLVFGEQPQIPVKTFYGSTVTESTPIRKRNSIVSTSVSAKSTVKPKSKPKASKTARFGGPTLGNINRGVRHKIVKPKTQTSSTSITATKSINQSRMIEAAMNILGTKNTSAKQEDLSITHEQIAKLQKVLRNQRNSFEFASKPLNWTGSQANLSPADTSTNDLNNTTFGEVSLMDNSALNVSTVSSPDTNVDEQQADVPKRKFFKSRTPSSTSKTYTVMKGLCATVKRGSGVTLSPPKPKKTKRKEDYYELQALKEDVSNIIDMLISADDDDLVPSTYQSRKNASVPQTVTLNTEENDTAVNNAMHTDPTEPLNTEENDTAVNNAMHTDPTSGDLTTSLCDSDMVTEDLTTDCNYQRFAAMLPYNTTDPEVQQRQETLLSLLYTNNICTEQNFKIFIAEPNEHQEEASRILGELFVLDVQDTDVGMDSPEETMEVPMSPASQISTMTLSLALGSPKGSSTTATKPSSEKIITVEDADTNESEKLFPVFDRKQETKAVSIKEDMAKKLVEENKKSKLPKWKPIGDKQLQLDAGQKKFGGSMCSCGMFYSVHEPEDEELHQKYHDIYNQLHFKGWVEERVVCSVPEWGIGARIICVTDLDSKMKRSRCSEFVALIDRELGYADIPTKPQSIVYLAINKRQVIGICVAEPLQIAHPLSKENGIEMMDLTKKCAVKCGISRIWVAGPHRRHGIAMRMFTALRSHFIRGYTMRLSEVAFSSPTELGRSFAARVTDKVLVY